MDKAYENGLMQGVGDGNFGPEEMFTREQFVTILSQLAGADVSAYKNATTSPFTDVNTSQWYAPYILWAYDNGYTNGYGDGTFGVNDAVTREQMAQFVVNYCDKVGVTLPTNVVADFADEANISSWAKRAVDMCHAAGIFNGDDNGKMNPKSVATRAESATVVCNVYDVLTAAESNGSTGGTGDTGTDEIIDTGVIDDYDLALKAENEESMAMHDAWVKEQEEFDKKYGNTTPDNDNVSDNISGNEGSDNVSGDNSSDNVSGDNTSGDDADDVDGTTSPEPSEPEVTVPETPDDVCVHEYEVVGYELMDGSIMEVPEYDPPCEISTLVDKTLLFLTGYSSSGDPIVEHLNPVATYGLDSDLLIAHVWDEVKDCAAYAKGGQCQEYANPYSDLTETDFKVYYENTSYAVPKDAVSSPSQTDYTTTALFKAHFTDPEGHGFSSTSVFTEYIYQIVKPVYSTTCSKCGE